MIHIDLRIWLVVGAMAVTRGVDAGQQAAASTLPATRDASRRTTIRAVRLTAPIRLDGRLDEDIYASVLSTSDFLQVEPAGGVPATEQTQVWVSFDDDRVYVSIRCLDSRPDRMIVNEMRRDHRNFDFGEYVGFLLDTFHDRRNAFYFSVNPLGGRADGQIANEKQYFGDFNPIWDVKVGRFDRGWTVEAMVPFKSLRYQPGRTQVWGFNVERLVAWKNERSILTTSPGIRGQTAIFHISAAATLVGVEAPAGSKNLEIKPYVTADLASDLTATPRISNDVGGDAGIDMKYGLTQNLTVDLTYNTDFAQVEADQQQINLTRFNLFFPEKREFFLENQGIFAFGGTGQLSTSGDTPILFYSRRIGLNGSRVVPIDGGGRLTGRLSRFSVGMLNIQSADDRAARSPATNFTVVRVKRDVLRRSSIGLAYTGRSPAQGGGGRNDAYGVDGAFAFFDHLTFNTFWARTVTTGVSRNESSYRTQMDYNGDRYGVQLERLLVGDNFNPQVGFLRRQDMRRHFGLFRFSPRPRSLERVRKFFWTGSILHIENNAGTLETRTQDAQFAVEFQNSDQLTVQYTRAYEFLTDPFPITPVVTIPVGGYHFDNVRASFNFGRQRPVSGTVSAEHGTFFSGHKSAAGISAGRVTLSRQLSVDPSVSVNWVDLPEGAFTTILSGLGIAFTMTPRMFVSALMQYNSDTDAVSANIRLRWEYQPGSELFVVYNEQRNTESRRFPDLANQAFIIKINRLFRF